MCNMHDIATHTHSNLNALAWLIWRSCLRCDGDDNTQLQCYWKHWQCSDLGLRHSVKLRPQSNMNWQARHRWWLHRWGWLAVESCDLWTASEAIQVVHELWQCDKERAEVNVAGTHIRTRVPVRNPSKYHLSQPWQSKCSKVTCQSTYWLPAIHNSISCCLQQNHPRLLHQ